MSDWDSSCWNEVLISGANSLRGEAQQAVISARDAAVILRTLQWSEIGVECRWDGVRMMFFTRGNRTVPWRDCGVMEVSEGARGAYILVEEKVLVFEEREKKV